MYTEISKCRICGNKILIPVLNLGRQYLTGVFPRNKNEHITAGPLELVKCHGEGNSDHCGLLQLKHSYDLSEMYGDNYGYRSGLNKSMVDHLNGIVKKICSLVELVPGDLVIDIGSNDSTLLQQYPPRNLLLVGVDPTGVKFRKYYPTSINLIPDFFSERVIRDSFGEKKAKIITSIAMFYDLESPLDFMKQVHNSLDDDGVWVFEQSYLPSMLEMNAYDTVCHEHLEYYSFKQIKWLIDKAGFKVLDVEFNNVNGGSFLVMVAKTQSIYNEDKSKVYNALNDEREKGIDNLATYQEFKHRVDQHKSDLRDFIIKCRREGKKVFGYGASTKGNVILQFCNLSAEDIPFIAEINADKFGCYTPGTLIPIISEEEARVMNPDYFVVLPWHFKEGVVKREAKYLESGGQLFFPLPHLDFVKM